MPIKDPEARRAYNRKHYLANKDSYNRRIRDAVAKTKAIIRSAKDSPCFDCGVEYPYWIMQFDHLRDKSFNIGDARYIAEEKLYAEIFKCEVVCANCHADRTHRRSHSSIVAGVGFEPTLFRVMSPVPNRTRLPREANFSWSQRVCQVRWGDTGFETLFAV